MFELGYFDCGFDMPGWKIFPKLPAGRPWDDHSSLVPVVCHVELCLCQGNRLAVPVVWRLFQRFPLR
jgi:hypothetical protein